MSRAAIVLVLGTFIAFGQANHPAFEVASIKPDRTDTSPHRFQFLPGGRFRAVSTWVKYMIEQAYDLKDYQVSGGPAWIISDRFDVEAKAADGGTDERQMRLMLQSLLADRFQLKIRRETKEFPVYDLMVAKNGTKVKPLEPGDASDCRRENSEICGLRTMARLEDFLTNVTGRPVFDKTGIQGDYNLLITFDIYEVRNQIAPAHYNKPLLATALREQLGLDWKPRKAPLPVVVIESIQRPTEN